MEGREVRLFNRILPTERGIPRFIWPETCAICRSPPLSPVGLSCGHIFCLSCIDSLLEKEFAERTFATVRATGVRCPLCNGLFLRYFELWLDPLYRDIVREYMNARRAQLEPGDEPIDEPLPSSSSSSTSSSEGEPRWTIPSEEDSDYEPELVESSSEQPSFDTSQPFSSQPVAIDLTTSPETTGYSQPTPAPSASIELPHVTSNDSELCQAEAGPSQPTPATTTLSQQGPVATRPSSIDQPVASTSRLITTSRETGESAPEATRPTLPAHASAGTSEFDPTTTGNQAEVIGTNGGLGRCTTYTVRYLDGSVRVGLKKQELMEGIYEAYRRKCKTETMRKSRAKK